MNKSVFYLRIGSILRARRSAEHLTLDAISSKIHKGITTISKYETGTAAIPLDVLADYCGVLHIDMGMILKHVGKLCGLTPDCDLEHLWLYWYDGARRKLCAGVIEYSRQTSSAILFRNIHDQNNLYDCQSLYYGRTYGTDHSFTCALRNTAQPHELFTVSIPTLSAEPSFKIGLAVTHNSDYKNIAFKCLCSKTKLRGASQLIEKVLITKEEYRLIRDTNTFEV